jgi:hypothetical protein
MMRTPGTVLILGLLTACFDVGSVGGPGGGPDGGPRVDSGGGPDGTSLAATCKDEVLGVGNGEHNEGQSCMQAGCHAAGGEGPRYYAAGTLYLTAAGGAPNVGATITVRDANNLTLQLTSMQNGNFYTEQPLIEPVTVYASKCPAIMPMIATAAGNCNTGGCHDGVAATGRVYLP